MLQVKKFPDIPVSTRDEARESLPHPEEPRFRLLAREEGSFPAWSGKNSRRSCRISSGGALHRKGERNSRVVPPFPESPRYLSPFQGSLFSCTASTFKPRIDSDTVVRGTALWDSPVGKPRGKASRERHRSLDPREGKRDTAATDRGKRTCMSPLETSTDSPGETPEVPQDPCQHWRGIYRFRHWLHTRS